MNIYFGRIKYEEGKRKSFGAYVIVPSPFSFKGVFLLWNRHWRAYNLLAGHWEEEKDGRDENGEPNFFKTAVREIQEEFGELGIKIEETFYSLHKIGGKIEFIAYSQRAKEWTFYSHRLFLLEWKKNPDALFSKLTSPHAFFLPPYYLLNPDESPVPLADAIYILNNESKEFRDVLLKMERGSKRY